MNIITKDPILKSINAKLTKTERRIQTCYNLYGMHGTFCALWAIFVLIPFLQSLPNKAPLLALFQYPLLVALIMGFPITIILMKWEEALKKKWTVEQQKNGDVK